MHHFLVHTTERAFPVTNFFANSLRQPAMNCTWPATKVGTNSVRIRRYSGVNKSFHQKHTTNESVCVRFASRDRFVKIRYRATVVDKCDAARATRSRSNSKGTAAELFEARALDAHPTASGVSVLTLRRRDDTSTLLTTPIVDLSDPPAEYQPGKRGW